MDIEIGKEVARALVRDVEGQPHASAFFDLPPSQAGRIITALREDLAREARGDYSVVLFPNVRAVFRRHMVNKLEAGMGQWAEIIGGVLEAATAIYTNKLQIRAQKDILKMQAEARAKEAAAEKAAADKRAKEAEAAMRAAAAQPGVSPVTGAIIPGVAGLPGWVVPGVVIGGLVIMGVVAFVLDKKPTRKRRTKRRSR